MAHFIEILYRATHKGITDVPYEYKYPLWEYFFKPIRKWMTVVIIPIIPFNGMRIWLYRLNGFKIGKHCFIGMRCYLDDLCHKNIVIGNNVTVSYGVYFACHGRHQNHNNIIIEDGAYIGMKSCLICPKGDIVIGKGAIVGAMSLVNKSVRENATVVGVPAKQIGWVCECGKRLGDSLECECGR